MGKPMTPEAKQRLKEIADAKKGRATLKSLDVMGFAAALDAAQNGDSQFPGEEAGGFLDNGTFRTGYLPNLPFTFHIHERRADAKNVKDRRSSVSIAPTHWAKTVTHVELKHARDDQRELIHNWLRDRVAPIAKKGWAGPTRGNEYTATWLYPVQPMLRLIHAIWPGKDDDWRGKVSKYLHGYSAAWFRHCGPWGWGRYAMGEVVLKNASLEWRAACEERRHAKIVNEMCQRGLMYDYKPKA